MSITEEHEFSSFQKDLSFLIETLKQSFESTETEFYIDETNDILYLKLEGLDDYSQSEIEEIASPILEELDMDFEEIILMPI